MKRKGIVLAGGTGSRLYPITMSVSKQLLPVYDKPMIYYPISTLMLAGIREIAIITTPRDQSSFQHLLGDGSQWGLTFEWIVQPKPNGLAQAYILAEEYLAGAPSTLVLGDNIFFGHGLPELLNRAGIRQEGGTILAYHVSKPQRYGVVGFDASGRAVSIIEKPETPASNYAVTGLYFLDGSAPNRAKQLQPSDRGELEITTLLETYLREGTLEVEKLGRGYAWLDTGTNTDLLNAANFVRTLQERQNMQIGCPDEIAFESDWITRAQLESLAEKFPKSAYGNYLNTVLAREV